MWLCGMHVPYGFYIITHTRQLLEGIKEAYLLFIASMGMQEGIKNVFV
jgi:hypothetical protein